MTMHRTAISFLPHALRRSAGAAALLCLTCSQAIAGPGQSAEQLGIAPPQAIVTAPSLKINPLSPEASGTKAAPVGVDGKLSAPVSALEDKGAPWVLSSELHPWPLQYRELPALSPLLLDIPTEQETKLMLPGKAADMADRARFVVSKWISDAIGLSAQGRGRQLDALESWVGKIETQKRQVHNEAWQQYQFMLEAHREIESFRGKIHSQSTPGVHYMASEVKNAITKINTVMPLMPTYELRMAWYGVMVQLKDGLLLYQNQVAQADQQLTRKIEGFLVAHPPIARPAGNPPPEKVAGAPQLAPAPAAPAIAAVTPSPAIAKPAEPAPAQQAQPTSAVGGLGALIIIGVIVMGFMGLFMRKKKAPVAKAEPS